MASFDVPECSQHYWQPPRSKAIGNLAVSKKDLEPAIGKSNRVYEVLNRKRNLTLPMIRKLHTMFGIPLKSLVGG